MNTKNQKRSFALIILFAFFCIPLFSQGGVVLKKKNASAGNNGDDGCEGLSNSDEFYVTYVIPFSNLESDENGLPSNFPCDLALEVTNSLGSVVTIPLSDSTVYSNVSGGQSLIVNYDITSYTIDAACEDVEEDGTFITLSLSLICLDGSDPCEEFVSPSIYINGDCNYDTNDSQYFCCEIDETTLPVDPRNAGVFKSNKIGKTSSVIVRNQFGEIVYTLKGRQFSDVQFSNLQLNRGLYYITTTTNDEILTKLYYQID